jgi:hypothetical protein
VAGLAAMQRGAGNAAVSVLLSPPPPASRTSGAAMVVQRLLARIDPTMATINDADPTIEALQLDSSRPPTGLVNANNQAIQGDHTTAWALIKAEVSQAVEGMPVSHAYVKLQQAVDVWAAHTWARNLLSGWQEPDPKVAQPLANVKRLESYVEAYLKGRNSQPGAAYVRVGKKQPKASAATGSQGEMKAINDLTKLKSHGVDLASPKLVGYVIDLFDPPFTGKLKQSELEGFFDEELAPRLVDLISSTLLAVGRAGKASWDDKPLLTLVKNVVDAVLKDMDEQKIYGTDLMSQANSNYLFTAVRDAVPWTELNRVVTLN